MTTINKELTPIEKKEVKDFLVKARNKTTTNLEKNILYWSSGELNAYIKAQTKGMSITKKFKFGKDLVDKIKLEKENLKNVSKD